MCRKMRVAALLYEHDQLYEQRVFFSSLGAAAEWAIFVVAHFMTII